MKITDEMRESWIRRNRAEGVKYLGRAHDEREKRRQLDTHSTIELAVLLAYIDSPEEASCVTERVAV